MQWRAHRRLWLGVVAVLVVQALTVAVYRWVEESRRENAALPFRYEHLPATPAPNLSLARHDGSVLQLADLHGATVLLHFWATWCPPCREELAGLLELGRDLGRDAPLRIVAISLDDGWPPIRDFFGGEIPPEVFRTEEGAPAKQYDVSTLPDTYLITAHGSLRLRLGGARDWRTRAARDLVEMYTRP